MNSRSELTLGDLPFTFPDEPLTYPSSCPSAREGHIGPMKTLVAFLIGSLLPLSTMGRSPVGLWTVFSVELAGQHMTPQAKWSHFYKDGRYVDGNGWQQHHTGAWRLDADRRTFTTTPDQGPADDLGPFQLSFRGDTMIWQRTEEGEMVTVNWIRTEDLPAAPRNRIQGLWEISFCSTARLSREAANDKANACSLFFRWDDRYSMTVDGETTGGFYIAHGHRPEVILLPYDDEIEPTRYRIEVLDDGVRLVGKSEELVLKPLMESPN